MPVAKEIDLIATPPHGNNEPTESHNSLPFLFKEKDLYIICLLHTKIHTHETNHVYASTATALGVIGAIHTRGPDYKFGRKILHLLQ